MVPERWTLNRLACELDMDRRALGRNLAGLKPIEERKIAGGKRTERLYLLAEVITHISTDGDGELDLNQERAKLTKLQQERLRYEIGEMEGSMVRTSIVEPHWQGMVTSMRAKLLAVPSRAAGMIAPPDRMAQTQAILQDLVYEALTEIASDGVPDEVRERASRVPAEISFDG